MKFVLSMLFCLLCYGKTRAQLADHYQLSVFGTRNGLLSPKIYTLTQASDHHLWIGTEIGASRYNGYEFENIQYTAAHEQIGKIVAITEDSVGGMWLGGEGGLFYYFNGEVSRCVFVQNYVAAVEALTTDKSGCVWIGEMHGLYRLTSGDIKQWRTTKKATSLQPFGGIKERIICLDIDRKGNLYFGSFGGVYMLKNAGTDKHLIWKNINPGNLVRFITAVTPDSIFFNQYNGESTSIINGQIKTYTASSNAGHRFFTSDKTIFRLTTNTIERLQDNNFVPVINYGKQTNFAFDALCDAEGNIWIGTWEGLFKYRYNPFSIYQRKETIHPETFSFLETKDGKLLFGGNRGQIHYKKENDIIAFPGFKPVFTSAEVLAMYEHDDGSFWFGSGYQGITRFKAGEYTSFNEGNILPDNHCNSFYRVDENTVFACSEKGVIVLDPLAQNPFIKLYGFAKAYNRQPKLSGVFQPAENTFFFYSNQGLFRLKEGKLHTETVAGLAAENLYITKILRDKNGNVWLSTLGKGLLQCTYNENGLALLRQFTKQDGLPTDELLSLMLDKHDNVWVADYTSLSLLQQGNRQWPFINFSEQDGLPGNYYQHLHLAQQKNGTAWAINSMNIFSFQPDSMQLSAVAPKLFFNNMVLENGAHPSFSTATSVTLSHDENSVSLTFTAVSLSNPAKIKYAYRLMPGDTAWIITDQRKIYLNSLNPGSYFVEVKASNNTGLWSAPLKYSFKIKPPFWNTWWFHLLVTMFVLGISYWLFRSRIKAVKSKAAIQQQLTELESKALRAQMNPHFIFNCLNAIQELIVTKNVEAAYDYLSKFSRLLRLVLNNSEKAAITLADEIVMLQLYLELESLRFRRSFSYKIHVEESVDSDTVLVPPLLLQPFIENAIWHGLMLKEGEKKLSLSIKLRAGKIHCLIEDNGIGRRRAGEIKSQKIGAGHFDSRGLKLSQQRIQLFQNNGHSGTVQIEDLYHNCTATGTRVSIYLPVFYG